MLPTATQPSPSTHALFRAVNDNLIELNGSFERLGLSWLTVCECADRLCIVHLELRREQYERIRAHPNRFVVSPGCARASAGRVVERTTRYCVLEPAPDDAAASGRLDLER
jgi:hypothetical protein